MAQEFQKEIYESQHSGFLIEDLAGRLLKSSPNVDVIRPAGWVADSQWIRQSFIVGTDAARASMLDEIDRTNRSFSSASMKFTDTSLGGNTIVNPPPAFTRYADPPLPGLVTAIHQDFDSVGPLNSSIGQGVYYSEAIDDNNQVIHLRFGVPQFNSMTQFFTGFYSSSLGNAARAGRFKDSFVDDFLRTAGKVLSMALAPLAILPAAILMAGSAVRFFLNWPTSKFYTLRPSMPLYWNAVTSMVNQLAANMGIVTYMEDKQIESVIGKQQSLKNDDVNGQSKMSVLNRLSNGMINNQGAIDVIQIVNRAKRLEMNYEHKRMELLEAAGPDASFAGIIKSTYQSGNNLKALPYSPKGNSLESLLTRYLDKLTSLSKDKEDGKQIEMDPKSTSGEKGENYTAPQEGTKWYDYFFAELGDGSDWASFRVDYTGPVSESFTNSTAESSMAQKINGLTSSAHDIRMNYSGLASSIPGLETVLDGVKTVLGTVAGTLHLEGLAAFAGSSFVDIPHHWESSIAQLPKASYTINLVSPYGNPVSRMFNIYLPLCMLLAGALPLSTGKQSYTSPFLCQIHDRGRLFSRLAIIDSISITRGTGNLGFNNEGQPMAVEVQITFKDLTSIMAMPIQGSFWDQPLSGIFDSENAFSDYLMAMASMTLGDMTYRVPMLKYQIKRKMAEFSAFTSKAAIMNTIAGWPGVNALSGIMKGTSKK